MQQCFLRAPSGHLMFQGSWSFDIGLRIRERVRVFVKMGNRLKLTVELCDGNGLN